MKFSFTANATSKEDAKGQIRSDQNRDSPDWAKERVLKAIDEKPLTAGDRIRVYMDGESEDQDSLHVEIVTSAD